MPILAPKQPATRNPPRLATRTGIVGSTVVLIGLLVLAAIVFWMRDTQAPSQFSHRDDLSAQDIARIGAILTTPPGFGSPEQFEASSAGAGTSRASQNSNAFSHPSENLSLEGREQFFVGNGLFRKVWVSSPSSTTASDGLGPLFNARGCQRCHLKDGRGHPPTGPEDSAESLLVRLSVPTRALVGEEQAADLIGYVTADPVYGGQLQDNAVAGIAAEAHVDITWEEFDLPLNGEPAARLRQPRLELSNPGYGPFSPDLMTSIRVAPQMIGLGLLEAIHPGDIYALEDPDDLDGDGISGRAHRVPSPDGESVELGRFGWKAAMPTLELQAADAFLNDMGISSPLKLDAHGDCTTVQVECLNSPHGVQANLGDSEAPDPVLELVAFYSANLAVPERRDVHSPAVLRGKALFHEIQCAACHEPKYVTRKDAEREEHRFQLIWPYTDLLLHDMGEGLADNRPDGQASGREWRTPPLWGIGLTEVVSGHTQFLHDGRARNLTEAILWHGGEAEPSRDAFADLSPADRADLIAFLESL